MADDRLTTLYNLSEVMTSAGNEVKEKHENDYKTIIQYLKTSENSKERLLAAQLISRFFKYFPEHEHDAFDSIVDLCESADVDVRKHATMSMITICRDCKQVVSKAADILIQLYQTNQASEVNLINSSLLTLLKLDIEKFLKSFFANFEDGSEQVRERAIKFLAGKIHTVDESALTKEVEEQLLTYTKKALDDVTKDEFIAFIGILSKLKIAKTNSGQASIVAAIKSQAEMDKEFDVNNQDHLDKFLLCTQHSLPFLSQYIRASEYINYICLKILPHLRELESNGVDLKVLQALAEMSPHTIVEDVPELLNLEECIKVVYNKLLEYLPMPPEIVAVGVEQAPKTVTETKTDSEPTAAEATNGATKPDDTSNKTADQAAETNKPTGEGAPAAPSTTTESSNNNTSSSKQETGFQFTHIEYLMYTLIQLCRMKPELYTEAMQVASRKQLSHLSNGCKKYTNALEGQLAGVKRQDLMKEENKLRSVALRTTKNISTMIVGLFKRPLDFKTSIVLACKPIKEVVPPPQVAQNQGKGQNTTDNRSQQQHRPNKQYNNNNNNNNNNHNRGGGGGGYHNRQVGQKSKFRGNYQADYRGGNKRPRK